ncbi:MAG: cellulase family glycosylhydrolase [Ktedonobacterales bacterium]|nr:cellulase family glycosylhydrolase [Ktedonobacterales bacterium]
MQQHRRGGPIIATILVLAVIVSLGVVRAATQLGTTVTRHTTATLTQATSLVPTATPQGLLPGLQVQGTQFVDATGKTVRLIGATRQSLEYLCRGDGHLNPADFAAMRSWGMNVVRLPLSSEFWANAGGDCPDYRTTVTQTIYNAESAGLYVIADLQWNAPFDTAYDRTHGGVQCPLPDNGKDLAFWHDLATIYAHDGAVLFDLFGEPHDISWTSWQHGTTITAGCYIVNPSGEPQEQVSYTGVGMRDLMAQVRTIAPNNIIILSGLNWGYDLGGISSTANESNVVYGTHPFDHSDKQPADWSRAFGNVAQGHAVIATEFGSYDCKTEYIRQAIAYFNAHNMSWLAWAWDAGDCHGPSLLADWSGTPSQPYGAFVQAAMLKAQQ